jgi:hypothetical protein
VNALDLVKRVTSIGAGLVRRKKGDVERDDGTSAASPRRGPHEGEKPSLAMRATVRLIRASTVVAKGMQKLPHPPLGAQEKVALGAAKEQLEAMGAQAAAAPGALDPKTAEGALVELIAETVQLVERMLEGPKEMEERRAKAELPEVSEGSERTKISF